MKKVLFIVPEFPSISETFIVNQIIGLRDKGYAVNIFSLGNPSSKVLHEKIEQYHLMDNVYYPFFPNFLRRIILFFKLLCTSGYRKQILKSTNPFKYGKNAWKLTNFSKVYNLLKIKNDYDLVHIHFGQMLENYFLLKDIGLVNNKKTILTFHGYDLSPKDLLSNRKRYRRLLTEHIKVTVNTPYLENILNQVLPTFNNYDILPVGLDTSYFKKTEVVKSETVNIVFCGRFIRFKGIEHLPVIINTICSQYPDVKFHIIGDGNADLKANFLTNVETQLAKQRVLYYGSIPQQQIIEIYNHCDIFILPGTYDNGRAETQGLVIQEAQAMELAVVVTDAGGMRYGVMDGLTGMLAPHKDIQAFVSKVGQLIDNPDLRKNIGKAARKVAVEQYDNKVLASKLIEIYES